MPQIKKLTTNFIYKFGNSLYQDKVSIDKNMDTIKYRNKPAPYLYLFIILAFGSNVILNLWSGPTLFYTACSLIILICIVLYVRTIEIFLDKDRIKIKLRVLKFTYKTIDLRFDIIKLSGSLDDTISFYKNNVEILSIEYVDHIEEPTYTVGSIEINYKQKTFEIGNKKSSFALFEKIKHISSKHITTADMQVNISS